MPDIPANASTTASVDVGETVVDTLEFNGDHDWFRIELTAGESITISLDGISLTDPYLRIRDANGNVIYENDDIQLGVDRDSQLSFTASSSGTYYIDVGAWDEAYAGDYQLSVTPYTPPPLWTNDQVAEQLVSGYWAGDVHSFGVGQGGNITVNITALTVPGQNLAREALALWSDIIGVDFVEVTSGGQMIFDDDEEGAFAEGFWANGVTSSVNVNVSSQWLINYGTGLDSYSFQTYIHEIGHALGLGHAGNYNETARYPYDVLYQNDSWPVTVMSYFDQNENTYFAGEGFTVHFIGTPMVADIIAMEELYGLSTTTRQGDTTYGFNSNAGRAVYDASLHPNLAYTVFDSGGTDTLDYSGFSGGQRIDLHSEAYSNVGGGVGNVSIARGTTIENAIGGSGNDTIIGNSANNVLNGGAGNDSINGGGGNDIFSGQTGSDRLTGGAGNDTFRDSAARLNGDTITDFSVGDRIIITDANLASFTFSLSGDTLTYSGGSLSFGADLAGPLVASAASGGGVQLTIGQASPPDDGPINGSAADDFLQGDAGDDQINGFAGDDFLIGAGGLDLLDGGAGSDVYMIEAAGEHGGAEFADSGDSGTDEVRFAATGSAQTLVLRAGDTGIERIVIGTGTGATAVITGLVAHDVDARALANGVEIVGNSGDNTLYATGFADSLSGGNGEDRFYAYEGADTLDGGRDRDIMYGGRGDDTYIVDHESDAPIELAGEGTDTVLASRAHTLKDNVEHLEMTGIYSIHGRGNALANTMTGNSGSNRMWGLGGNDTLIGNAGGDRLDGGDGSDILIGGSGNDIYYVGSSGDSVTELSGEGRDTVEADLSWTLGDNVEWLRLTGNAGIDGSGNSLANVLWGNAGANDLSGLGGNDKIYAGGGNDNVDGGGGSDWLEGEEGRDVYTGGSGSDRFVFRDGDFGGSTTATADVITDFGDAEGDRIHLSVVDANASVDGNQAFAFVGTAAFTGSAGELRYEQIGGDTYVSGDTDGDGFADFMIRLDGLHTLGTDDFVF